MLSETQRSQIHCCTCFLLWIIPHLPHSALYFKTTPLRLTQELAEDAEPRPWGLPSQGAQCAARQQKSISTSLLFSCIFRCHQKNSKAKNNSHSKTSNTWTLFLLTGGKGMVEKDFAEIQELKWAALIILNTVLKYPLRIRFSPTSTCPSYWYLQKN